MPTRERSLGRLVFLSEMDVPSTTMSPCWIGSTELTVLISVDLPEPDGPQTTTTSPLLIVVVQSVSTWKLPYHLEMFLMSIMGSLSTDDLDLCLQATHQHRQAEGDDEVAHRGQQVHLGRAVEQVADRLEALEPVGRADGVDQRG